MVPSHYLYEGFVAIVNDFFQALLEDNKEGDTLDLSPWQHD